MAWLRLIPEERDRTTLKQVAKKSGDGPADREDPNEECYLLEFCCPEEADVEKENRAFDTEKAWWIASLENEE